MIRLRLNFDLRTTAEHTSQRMMNALEVGTHVQIHRHLKHRRRSYVLKDALIGCSLQSKAAKPSAMRSFLGLIQVGRCIMGKRQRMIVVL